MFLIEGEALMKGIYIVRYKDIDKNKWDEFVDQNDSAWFWHTSSF